MVPFKDRRSAGPAPLSPKTTLAGIWDLVVASNRVTCSGNLPKELASPMNPENHFRRVQNTDVRFVQAIFARFASMTYGGGGGLGARRLRVLFWSLGFRAFLGAPSPPSPKPYKASSVLVSQRIFPCSWKLPFQLT